MVEGTVGVITNFVLGALRNRRFLSLPELNEAIWERLGILNNAPFQKRDGSRAAAFARMKRHFCYHFLPDLLNYPNGRLQR